ncbi:restriction endonuclease subunit S [Vibrio sp. 1159]|uniref:restriction endonuclease subunit S n=1 Tax=Vibrio sp. 1159 TaxID=3074545 RepID=UPI002963FEF9|nr:restriction endonuclease subunit S [Vibrio sp. 1159]MDW2320727.1 restriction endonuclease subunit S [Vibrio sp. 1159]
MSMEKNVPEIRFNGFSGEWAQRPFGDCFDNIPNNTLSRADLNYEHGIAKNVHYGDVLIKFGEILDASDTSIPFVTDENVVSKQKHAALKNGDIVIADAAEDSTVGKCTELFNIDEQVILSGLHTIAVRPNLPFASKYLGYYLNSSLYHDQLLPLMQGTKVLSISKTALKNTSVNFPSVNGEQIQIGNYFQKLDSLINQHKQKHEKLSNIKKAMLEKMFPKQGETIPEIRFKGFGEEWKESSIGEICGVTFGGGTPSTNDKDFWQGEIPWIQSSDLKDGIVSSVTAKKYITKSAVNKSTTKLISGNSIAIVTRVGVGKISLMQGEFATSQDFLSLSDLKINSQYAVYVIWKQLQIEKEQVQGTSIKGITKDELLGKSISYPDSEEEQTAIGNYFQKLDALINRNYSPTSY